MALKRTKKSEVVSELVQLLSSSKLTVVAFYRGLTVKQMQELRKQASDNGTTIKVVKNRLVKKALEQVDALKETDTSLLRDQLIYAFNADDEVAPAQVFATFAKQAPQLQFVGAINVDGTFLSADDVKALASLPSKDQLRGQLVGTLAAPLSGFVNVLAGNVRGILNVLNARAESLGQ